MERDAVVELERIEIEARIEMFSTAPADVRESLGLVMERFPTAIAFGRARDTNLMFQRVLGLGLEAPATRDEVRAIKSCYASRGIAEFGIGIAPDAEPDALESWLRDEGFGCYFHTVKWTRDVSPARRADCGLAIETAGAADADAFGRVLVESFHDRPENARGLHGVIGRGGWTHYVARDGGDVVGIAALFRRGATAWFGLGATLASHRGRGAQSALIARRIEDARAAGCTTLVVETGPSPPEKPNPSYHNVERAGFRVAYLRRSWVFPDPGAK